VVLNLVGKNAAWEFSYMKINRNKDNVFDLTIRDVDAEQDDITRWDGYYAHLQPKFRLDKNGYIGLLLGYSEKKFEPLSSNAIHEADGIATYGTFAPVNTQFITMINIGGMALERGVGADVYFGIGATYNEWKLGSSIHTDEYAIENIVLENRKDNYFSFIMRVGMTVGLNFGRGNMK
jgi:hypothetical protein